MVAVVCLFLLFIYLNIFWLTKNECCSTDEITKANFPIQSRNGAYSCYSNCLCLEERDDNSKYNVELDGGSDNNACGTIIG